MLSIIIFREGGIQTLLGDYNLQEIPIKVVRKFSSSYKHSQENLFWISPVGETQLIFTDNFTCLYGSGLVPVFQFLCQVTHCPYFPFSDAFNNFVAILQASAPSHRSIEVRSRKRTEQIHPECKWTLSGTQVQGQAGT